MNSSFLRNWIAFALLSLRAGSALGASLSVDYRLAPEVFASGGETAGSDAYRHAGTLGETFIGEASAGAVTLRAGFHPVTLPSADGTPLPAGLVSWWRAEGNGQDLIGGNHGTVRNGAAFAEGQVGQAFLLDGVSGHISIPDHPSLDLLAAGTVELWLRLDEVMSDRPLLNKGNSANNQASYTWGLYLDNLRFDLYRGDGSTAYSTVTIPAASLLGGWHHLAVTWADGSLRAYRDGVLAAEATYSFTRLDTADDLLIGGDPNGHPPLRGAIDEVSLYDRALTAGELQAIFDAGTAGKDAATPTFASAPPNQLAVGQPFSHQFLAQLGTPPYRFTLDSGELPPGITLSPTGTLGGTTTTWGTHRFALRVTDANGRSATKGFLLDAGYAIVARDLTLGEANTTYENLPLRVAKGAVLTLSGPHHFTALLVEGTITHPVGDLGGIDLTVDGATIVAYGGVINVSERGGRGGHRDGNPSVSGEVPNAANLGWTAANSGIASHGTPGFNAPASAVYGDAVQPLTLGSGGGAAGFAQYPIGGTGGGLVRLDTGSLDLNGSILANGGRGYMDGNWASSFGFGGSGGSVNLTIRNGPWTGTGQIRVDGGGADPYPDQFAGFGRIAVQGHSTNGFSGSLGPAGSTYLAASGQSGELRLGNTTVTNAAGATLRLSSLATNAPGRATLYNLGVLELGEDVLDLPGGITLVQDGIVRGRGRTDDAFGSLTVRSNAVMTHSRGLLSGLRLNVAGLVTIDRGGALDVSGKGLRGGRQGGMAYGGEWWNGGNPTLNPNPTATYGEAVAKSNPLYGDAESPDELGTGGGAQSFYFDWLPIGGNGGGRLLLQAQSLVLNGGLYSDGEGGYNIAGGGSGGALRVMLAGGTFAGDGVIRAAGGRGDSWADGGSGRIAISGFDTNEFTGTLGRAGTLLLRPLEGGGVLRLDNTFVTIASGQTRVLTQLTVGTNGPARLQNEGTLELAADELTVPAGLTLIQDGEIRGRGRGTNVFGSLTVRSNAVITHSARLQRGVQLKVDGPVLIEEGGYLNVSGQGLSGGRERGLDHRGEWWNGGTPEPNTFGGATYGETLSYAHAPYGDPQAPGELGSGGAADYGFNDIRPHGGTGGGRVFLVARSLQMDGGILADGIGSCCGSAFGGSGGAIRILLEQGDLTGKGLIRADGGAGDPPARRGGGGRIAISGHATGTFSGTIGSNQGSLFHSAEPEDRDADGLPDAFEYFQGLDPGLAADALADEDGDGQNRQQEYEAGTNPHDAADVFRAVPAERTENSFKVKFAIKPGRKYKVEARQGLFQGQWQTYPSVIAVEKGHGEFSFDSRIDPEMFFRVLVQP